MTELQVRNSLKNKHSALYSQNTDFKQLTDIELDDIIYKDRSRYRQKPSATDGLKMKMKQLEIEAKQLDIRRLKEEYKVKKEEADKITKQLMEESTPEDFNLQMYQRINVRFISLAIQSMHPTLSEKQCGLIIGSWVRRGL